MLGDPQNYLAVIKVVGVGGGGGNAVNRMIDCRPEGRRVHRGEHRCPGAADERRRREARHRPPAHPRARRRLRPGVGRQAAEDHRDEIEEVLKGADMVFITAGEGGGTGTGGAPIVAEIARGLGALDDRDRDAPVQLRRPAPRACRPTRGMQRLREKVDTLIVIPNDRLLDVADEKSSLLTAFKMADDVLLQGVQGITDLITTPGLINTDFADVRMIMQNAGHRAHGHRSGVGRGPRARPRPAPRSRARCSRRASRARAVSCSTWPARPTSACSR